MAISASLVKELREKTQAGMMVCKRALEETDGDVDAAIVLMRKKGDIKAQQKAGRTAAEGIVIILSSSDQRQAVLLEINSETDFVGKDENFLTFSNAVANVALEQKIGNIEALLQASMPNGESVEQNRLQLISKIGENIQVRRISYFSTETGLIGQYVHSGRIGVLVEVNPANESLAKDIAMHIAASKPLVVNRDDVPQEYVEKEKEIFMAQARESGKPEDIIEKMVQGRINKFLDEVSLAGQPFVKDPSQKISQLLKSESVSVVSFVRLEVGEGIEKKVDNFAEEVMSQVQS